MVCRFLGRFVGLFLLVGLSAFAPGWAGYRPWIAPVKMQRCQAVQYAILPQDVAPVLDSVVIVQNDETIGSGVVVSPEGYILTAAHVVGDAKTVAVYLRSGDTLQGHVLRADPKRDVALLKLSGKGYACRPVQKNAPLVGSVIYGLGVSLAQNQLSYNLTPATVSGYRPASDDQKWAYLQTDADLPEGNSGGPLFNPQGEVVGIVSWKMTSMPYQAALSFGIPISAVEQAIWLTM